MLNYYPVFPPFTPDLLKQDDEQEAAPAPKCKISERAFSLIDEKENISQNKDMFEKVSLPVDPVPAAPFSMQHVLPCMLRTRGKRG